ncbi:MAG TPA: glycosyltransferase [Longimicrobiales bacterium]
MIYICIPTHNEQQTVGVVLWKLRQVLTDFPRDYQLLVADDASTDKTPDVLEPYTRVLPLTVIRSGTRQGYAAALEMLLREAVRRSEYPKRDAIVTIQADFSDEPDDLVPLIKRLEAGADVAVGNKVSHVRDPRGRRLARSLASWFARGQKWPEGVTSPFDGFRAYRLHAVKRAIEERSGGRLLRFGGWAGHAELLREVLPHARRVDVVNVDDRRDRLQRPTRERAFAAAMQVRAMAGGAEPQGLAGVDELDRIAATASRSRERATATPRSEPTRSNGSRTRTGRQSSEGRREPAGRRTNGAGPAGKVERKRPRQRTQDEGRGADAAESRRRRQDGHGDRAGPGAGARRKPRREQAAAVEAVEETVPVQPTAEAEPAEAQEAAERPKRKRKRRRRSSGQGTAAVQDSGTAGAGTAEAAAGEETVEAEAVEGPLGVASDEQEADSTGEGAGAKKRRRRGGRRGGRGRRRGRGEQGQEQEGAGTDGPEPVAGTAAPLENE